MGNFSRETFNKLKHYVGVRLQQGIPIVDADWNEMEDIRKYELRSFLKWFVGNGIPYGNDGFKISAVAAANDFAIQGGDGTADGAGRCLVDGLDVMNESNLNYTAQALYNNNTLATKWGVAPLPPLSTPTSDRTDTVYLDVWEREVTSTEDPNLINPAIGIETAVRRKREWVVRVAENATAPPAPAAEHAHYALARLNRLVGNANITKEMIVDRRNKGLRIPSYYDIQQIKQDAFGSSYTLDNDGQPNLTVSLREAINALLRGGLPATSEQSLTTGAVEDGVPSALSARNGDIWLFWTRTTRTGSSSNTDVWYKRYTRATNAWGADTQLTTDTHENDSPVAVEDSNGVIWVFWASTRKVSSNVWYNCYTPGTGWQVDTNLSSNSDPNYSPRVVADHTGGVWVFWQRTTRTSSGGNTEIWFNHYTPGGSWQVNEQLTNSTDSDESPYAVAASNGDIWLFWQRTTRTSSGSNTDIWSARYEHSTGAWKAECKLTLDSASGREPIAIEDGNGTMWVFWRSYRGGNSDIWYKHNNLRSIDNWSPDTALTTDTLFEPQFAVLRDETNRIWVFWLSSVFSSEFNLWLGDISFKTYTIENGWGSSMRLTTNTGFNFYPAAITDNQGKVHVFWSRLLIDFKTSHIWTRVLTPQI
jgi:hypothetical protein